jgi:hypothetical protein
MSIPVPDPVIAFHFYWDGPHYGPACTTVGDNQRAHASHITITVFPDDTPPSIDIQGTVMTQKGERDRRHSYAKLCWKDSIDDAVYEALLVSVRAHLAQ